MINLSFTGDSDKHVLEFFDQSEARILATIEPTLQLAMEDLKTYIQGNKLQGQVLKSHKDGAGLAGSLNVRMESEGLVIAGYVGTALIYARIHEYGFSGAETVNEYTQMRRTLFGKSVAPYRVFVSEHVRQMVMPARPYMGPSLEEKKEAIMQRLRDAVIQAIQSA